MDNRRKQNRKYLTFFSRVVNRKTGRLVGYLADLTIKGGMLIGDKPIGKDTVLHLRMDLPDNFSAQEYLDFDAKAVWTKPDADPDFYKTGLFFMDISEEDFALLDQILNEFGFSA